MKKRWIACMLMLAMCLEACNGQNRHMDVKYKYCVISSEESESNSELIFLDDDLKITGKKKIDPARVGDNIYGIPRKVKDKIYMLSLGAGVDKEDCSIVEWDTKKQEIEKDQFGDTICLTDFAVNEQQIVTVGNLNGHSYFNRYDRDTQKTQRYEIDRVVTELCMCKNEVYGFTNDEEGVKLYKIDISKQNMEELVTFPDYLMEQGEPTYYYYNEEQDAIYFPSGRELEKLCLKTRELESIELSCAENIWGCYADGQDLYISVTDPFDIESEASILKIDMTTDRQTATYSIDSGVNEFWIDQDEMLVLGIDNIVYQYKLEKDNCRQTAKIDLNKEGYEFLSALFVK